MTDKDIKSKPIYDKNGNLIGNITGRREEIERFTNRDLNEQLQSDRQKHRERLRDKR